MLTTAQQKVKQELEELQINALTHHYDKQVIPRKRYPFKKWIITIIAIILLMVTGFLLLKEYWTQKELGVTSYIMKAHDYNQQSETILNNFLAGNLANIVESRGKQENILIKVTKLPTSTSFDEHHQDLITVIEHRLDMMTAIKDPIHSDQIQLNKALIELSVKHELAVDSLIEGFEQEKIKYKRHVNGTIQYWINSKSYLVEQ
ncbi:hypothetical protein KW850_10570 [Bacillus sp. sid0103]|uniref:hypothetical protein n=1 Tax=Bacillus sp. sid0103 TaxID=2856337 RepID=UPI001C4957C6|nr:hypothetical protein [Bacillus sp. sid0103]MBV7505696.1 hypothetical protein [Bacillus sp. sid0103]